MSASPTTPVPRLELACRDGKSVHLRPLTPADREALQRGLESLSEASRYQRFLGARDHLTRAELRYLTAVDGHDHVAWAAAEIAADGVEQGLGVGRFVRLSEEADAAEPAFTVADHAQGRGIGTLLLGVMARLATREGVVRFRASVLSRNRVMLGIFSELGATLTPSDQGAMNVDLVLQEDPRNWPDTPAGEVCRRAARAVDALLTDQPPPPPAG